MSIDLVERARDLVAEITNRRYQNVQSESQADKLLIFILAVKNDYRFYALSSDSEVEAYWDIIRADETLLDFVVPASIELRMRCNTGGAPWVTVCKELSAAYGSFTLHNSAVDEETYNRMPKADWLEPLFDGNPWLVFIMLLETIDLTALGVVEAK